MRRQEKCLFMCALMLVSAIYAMDKGQHFYCYCFMILYLYFITKLKAN